MNKTAKKKWGQRSLALTAISLLLVPLGAAAATAAPTCDNGFLVEDGQRCVLWENITHIDKSPQPTDPGNYFYDFDKSYANMGELLKNNPMIPADADLGGFYMFNGNFVRLGVSYPSYTATNPPVKPSQMAPYRTSVRQKQLPYNLNAVKGADGSNLAAPNCTVCHSSVFDGKLVQGLGRFNHFIGADASGFTLNVLGIAVNSIFRGDTIKALTHGVTLLVRLFRGASLHDHLFDVFADLGMRHDPDTLKWTGVLHGNPNSGMKGWIDFPAWWLVKKENAMYMAGTGRGAKADHMLYMSWFSVNGIPEAAAINNNFAHVQAWIENDVKAPKYTDFGHTINQALADEGKPIFNRDCAVCHGTYTTDHTNDTYPNYLVDLNEVGTDPYLATHNWIYPVKKWWDNSWYGKRGTSWIVKTHGYVAPPLDGVWITAPYFHNGSVPTLEGVLDSSKRPTVWTSSFKTKDYDWVNVGWQNKASDSRLRLEVKPVTGIGVGRGRYDTRLPGDSNKGHTYGDKLTPEERSAVIEYLKTL